MNENFDKGIKSTVFINAPAGLIYPGDPGFPEGTSGLKKQWMNLSPRIGAGWDVNGDGRLAVRTSYAINYDYPGAVFQNTAVQSAPFNNRIDLIGNLPFDDPYRNDSRWAAAPGDWRAAARRHVPGPRFVRA